MAHSKHILKLPHAVQCIEHHALNIAHTYDYFILSEKEKKKTLHTGVGILQLYSDGHETQRKCPKTLAWD
jgi:hypothetical protein